MGRTRVIPVLLLKNNGLYKSLKFKELKYVGDPVNAVKIFNEKEVDEIIILDITASKDQKTPNFRLISDIAGECFMPCCYGGGITTVEEIRMLLKAGIEKVALNTASINNPSLITEASLKFGSQSIVVSMDVRKNLWGSYQVFSSGGNINTKMNPVTFAQAMEKAGAGEILLNSIDRDGTMEGYDVNLVHSVSSSVNIPVIACGGAGNIAHFSEAVKAGASAVAAGSMFVFHGRHRAVLISFPSQQDLTSGSVYGTKA